MTLNDLFPLTLLGSHEQLYTVQFDTYCPESPTKRGYYVLLRGFGPDPTFASASAADNLAYGNAPTLADAVKNAQSQLTKQYVKWQMQKEERTKRAAALIGNLDLDFDLF